MQLHNISYKILGSYLPLLDHVNAIINSLATQFCLPIDCCLQFEASILLDWDSTEKP